MLERSIVHFSCKDITGNINLPGLKNHCFVFRAIKAHNQVWADHTIGNLISFSHAKGVSTAPAAPGSTSLPQPQLPQGWRSCYSSEDCSMKQAKLHLNLQPAQGLNTQKMT